MILHTSHYGCRSMQFEQLVKPGLNNNRSAICHQDRLSAVIACNFNEGASALIACRSASLPYCPCVPRCRSAEMLQSFTSARSASTSPSTGQGAILTCRCRYCWSWSWHCIAAKLSRTRVLACIGRLTTPRSSPRIWGIAAKVRLVCKVGANPS